VEEGRDTPSPYARLNQLTLEMLAGEKAAGVGAWLWAASHAPLCMPWFLCFFDVAGRGTPAETAALIEGIREAEAWATGRREEDPSDVWLWVQAVDARCLLYLLGEPSATKDEVSCR